MKAETRDPFEPVNRMEWIPISRGVPEPGQTFIYLTVKKKIMVCANLPLDEWFIHKYGVTHWAYPPKIK